MTNSPVPKPSFTGEDYPEASLPGLPEELKSAIVDMLPDKSLGRFAATSFIGKESTARRIQPKKLFHSAAERAFPTRSGRRNAANKSPHIVFVNFLQEHNTKKKGSGQGIPCEVNALLKEFKETKNPQSLAIKIYNTYKDIVQ